MSFDIPQYIEPSIEQYANAQHITHDEAIIRLIQAGLERALPPASPRDILGAFSSPEDSEAMDEALNIAMQDRERRNAPHA